jgi:exopolysaccharide biosynthesis polyprenyl glycosylphosphotransferase
MSTIERSQERLEQLPSLKGRINHVQPTTKKIYPGIQYQWRIYIAVLVIFDLFMTFCAFRLAYWLRFNSNLPFFSEDGFSAAPFYDGVMLGVVPIWLIIFAMMGLYSRQYLLGGVREYSSLFNATTLGMLLIITARFTFPDTLILARGWAFIAWLLTFLMVGIARFTLRRVVYYFRSRGYFRSNALIIGYNEEGRLMAEQFTHSSHSSMNLVGYVSSEPNQCADCVYPALENLGDLENIRGIVQTHQIARLVLTNSALTREQVLSLYREFGISKSTDLLLSSGLYEMLTTGLYVQEDGSVPLVAINKIRMTGIDQMLKNCMDYILAFIAVVILSPFLALIAILVKLDSPGPIIYRRRVMGVNGRQFDAFKFRTMDTRSEEILRSDPRLMHEYLENFKIKDDPRITRIGKFLRKTSVDELPQLFNVLGGQMSLVGPRMITPEELDKYNQWNYNLLTVKPGITGLWQVRGRSDVLYEERVRMDMYYIRNWTFWLDIQLLVQTIPAVLAKRGAY